MIKKVKSIFFLLLLIFCGSNSYADSIGDDLKDFFESIGFTTEKEPKVYRNQEMGGYDGGEYAMIGGTDKKWKLAEINLPEYKYSCGKIDLYAGGFSFINSDQLIAMYKDILNNAKVYAFHLALESATPEISNVLKHVHEVADKINKFNINSCEMAASLVDSTWEKITETGEHNCEAAGSERHFSDAAEAKEKCGSGDEAAKIQEEAKKDERYKNMVVLNTNLLWHALMQNQDLKNNKDKAELIMSLVGTTVYSSSDNKESKAQVFPSLLANSNLWRAIFSGGRSRAYQCNDFTDCLRVDPEGQIYILYDDSQLGQVSKMVNQIANTILAKASLTEEEKSFLQANEIPIYKLISVVMAAQNSKDHHELDQYSRIIAEDVTFRYIEAQVNLAETNLSNMQYPAQVMQELHEMIRIAHENLRNLKVDIKDHGNEIYHVVRGVQEVDHQFLKAVAGKIIKAVKYH
jgi:conjugative transfer pilus assembly protein TraH